ncbi:MAG: amidohydrolase family protein [Burkholderiales bacterium]
MIIDVHGHFTTTPPQVADFRQRQQQWFNAHGSALPDAPPAVSDEEIREGIEPRQLRRMKERGVDLTIFSPRAIGMDHHTCDEASNIVWARSCNDLIDRVCRLYPEQFIGVCQLPQAAGVRPGAAVIEEIDRRIGEQGFIGVNLNPDPTGGRWSDPPLWDKDWWYPVYERLVHWDVPAMLHVSGCCNPHFEPAVASHYLNGDTTAFVQCMTSSVFQDFPSLRFVIPHGGGAVPFHWGRFRGLAQDRGLPELEEGVLRNVWFDTCVYHQAGIDLMGRVLPAKNILFASETFGAVQGIDPRTNQAFDDTQRYIDASPEFDDRSRRSVYALHALQVYPRLRQHAGVARWLASGPM